MTEESNFASETSCHGVRNVIFARNSAMRMLWIACIVASLGFFIWQFAILTTDYDQFNAVTEVKVKTDSALRFPALTFCNYNRFKNSTINQYAAKYGFTANEIWEYLILTIQTENFTLNKKAFGSGVAKALDKLRSKTKRMQMMEKAELDLYKMVKEVSFTYSETIPGNGCSFFDEVDKSICEKNFQPILTPAGMCFTFNGNVNSSLMQSSVGSRSGFLTPIHAAFNENAERLTELVGGEYAAGFKMMVHQPGVWPSLVSPVSFSTGKQVFVSISRKVYENERSPWGECVQHNLKYFPVYTEEACRTECLIMHIHQKCNCHPIIYPKHGGFKFNKSSCTNKCDVACYHEEYKAIVNEIKIGTFSEIVRDLFKMINQTSEEFERGWAMINVYYSQLQSLHYIQKEGKTMADLIADVGGQLGLAMGISFITIAEFIIYCCGFIFKKRSSPCKKKKNQVTEIKKDPLQ